MYMHYRNMEFTLWQQILSLRVPNRSLGGFCTFSLNPQIGDFIVYSLTKHSLTISIHSLKSNPAKWQLEVKDSSPVST